MKSRSMLILPLNTFIILSLIISCATTNKSEILHSTHNDILSAELIAVDSIVFQNPIIDFCVDKGNNLLILDASQEKIYRIELATYKLDTMLLPQKINFFKGIATDGIFIYLYSENSLYQYDNIKQSLVALISQKDRIKIIDLTLTQEGEIFISDGLDNQIVHINSLGRIERFNIQYKDLFFPKNIYYDTQKSQLLVVNQAQDRIEIYSRIGNLISVVPIIKKIYVKILKYQNRIFVLQNNSKLIEQIEDGKIEDFFQSSRHIITNFAISNNNLLILDANKRIYRYSLQF